MALMLYYHHRNISTCPDRQEHSNLRASLLPREKSHVSPSLTDGDILGDGKLLDPLLPASGRVLPLAVQSPASARGPSGPSAPSLSPSGSGSWLSCGRTGCHSAIVLQGALLDREPALSCSAGFLPASCQPQAETLRKSNSSVFNRCHKPRFLRPIPKDSLLIRMRYKHPAP
ncbi:unnamed protein product [Rangifer tarandus platyrhynchus]|uniref:Uncharacterized protein n=1 Tax=Rangifer tarandus platyrhynchus TaxID=3082113 RepID=A0AC59ZMQ0_RANTA